MPDCQRFIWMNGQILPLPNAGVSPFDAGYLLGDGVFETLRTYGGRPFAMTRHWRRLKTACDILGISAPSREVFSHAMTETLLANDCGEARVRFTVTRGSQVPQAEAQEPTMTVTLSPLSTFSLMETIVTVPWPRNERSALRGIKSLSYGENILAMRHAKARNAGEALFGNTRSDLCEGTASNVFIIQNGCIATPSLNSGCLPGVTRELVIECAKLNGIRVDETELPMDCLNDAEEAFLTSSTRQVQPITRVNGKTISQSVGPVGRRVAELFKELVSENADP